MTIRLMRSDEFSELENFLYEAIYVPAGELKPPRSIVKRPELQIYVANFGAGAADVCFVAEVGGKIVGACWSRLMNDYGHIDNDTPSLALSVTEGFRRQGIATALLQKIFVRLAELNFKQVSLSVQRENFAALNLYRRLEG